MPPWCSFHWNHKRMVYRMLEIYRINSLVVLLPMVKEPVGALWPEWRGLLIPDLISGRKKKKKSQFPSTWACTFCFVAQIALKSMSMSWASRGCLPSALCHLNQLPQGLWSHAAQTLVSQVLTAPGDLLFIYLFLKDEMKTEHLWVQDWKHFVCVCVSVYNISRGVSR